MQRPAYSNIPPAHSPPLHHPVPQHVSTVPQLRSPPPPQPASQPQQGQYGYPQQGVPHAGAGQGGSGYMNQNFGGFINDSTAQIGLQLGRNAMMQGQEYVEQNVRLSRLQRDAQGVPRYWLFEALPTRIIVQPLRPHLHPQALLQRQQQLCPAKAHHHPLPLAAPPMVTQTSARPKWTRAIFPTA